MLNLNYCLACGINTKPNTKPSRPPLSKSILKIHQMNKTINPKFSKLLDQLINQKYDKN